MKNEFIQITCITFATFIACTHQRLSSKRSDVYIAGFFPYGPGVENSETGLIKFKFKLIYKHSYEFDLIFKDVELCPVLNWP